MNNFELSIVPVPVHFLKENTLYLVYEALLICADSNGYIDISNEELSEIIQKSSSSTTVTSSISVMKNIGVVERVPKKKHNKDHNKRVLRLLPPYDEISCLFKKYKKSKYELFFEDINRITNSSLVKSEVSLVNNIPNESINPKISSKNKDRLVRDMSKNVKEPCHIGGSYLDDLDVSRYFKAYEYYNDYNLTYHVGTKRNMSEEIILHNLSFIKLINEEKTKDKINKIIKESKFKRYLEYHFDINRHAEEISPKTFKLFNFKKELNIEYLNDRYKAALVAYPDSLKNINRAYIQYNRLIKIYDLSHDEDSIRSFLIQETGFSSVTDFIFFLSCQLFKINVDIYDIEKSIEILYFIYKNLLISKRNIKYFFMDIPHGVNRLYKLYMSSDKSNFQFDLLKNIKFLNSNDGDLNKFYNQQYLEKEGIINDKKRFQCKINHIFQAENAYKYGMIDKKKYDNLVIKFTIREQTEKKDKKNATIESKKKIKYFY